MKKIYLIFNCFIISQLLIGQSKSIFIINKKSGKEIIINEGEKIKIKVKNNKFKSGKLEFFYDSSLKETQIKIKNYTLPFDLVSTINYNPTKENRLKTYYGTGLLYLGIPLGVISVYMYLESWWLFEELFVIPITVAGIAILTGVILLINSYKNKVFKKNKYKFYLK